MKLALIPPVSLLDTAADGDYQLALPHMLESDDVYFSWYAAQGNAGSFTILDNGEAEGENRFTTGELMTLAERICAKEIVAHDVMGDKKATTESTLQFIQEFGTLDGYSRFRLGIVAQGQDGSEVLDFIQYFLDNHPDQFSTIYLPRHLIGSLGLMGRVSLAKAMKQYWPTLYDHYDVHFLGAHHDAPVELKRAVHEVPYVRGMDTSMPYNYAYAGARIGSGRHQRPADYFNLTQEDFGRSGLMLVDENIQIMKRWIRSGS